MAQKQRACDIIGKALHKSKVNFRSRRKLNFDVPEPDEEINHHNISSCSEEHGEPIQIFGAGQNSYEVNLISEERVIDTEGLLLTVNEETGTAPPSPVITDLSNVDPSQYDFAKDSYINFILSKNDKATSQEQSGNEFTTEAEVMGYQTEDNPLPTPSNTEFEIMTLPSTSDFWVVTEPLPSTSSSAVLQSPPMSEPNINDNPSGSRKKRKAKHNKQYFDFLSDEEDFTAIFGDAIDSDTYNPTSESSESDEGINDTNKKKRKISNKSKNIIGEPAHQTEEVNKVGENAVKQQRKNNKKERRSLKQSGQAYTKKDGTEIPAKEIKPNPCIGKKCGNGCDSVTNEKRKNIFNYFWSLSTTRRKDWLVSMTQKNAIKRKRTNSEKRSYTYKYSITEGEGKRPVCLKFLAATLDVGLKFIQYTVQNSEIGLSKEDNRGKCEPHNKTKESTITSVTNFIKNLPTVPSHYCRKDSSRVYLPSEYKNLTYLYQHIYKKSYIEMGIDIVSERVFRCLFNERFNIGFHVPKKDKCIKCLKYEQSKNNPEIDEERKQHEKEKSESYKRFKAHQNIHKKDPSTLCASFDLQKVLNTPYGESMLLFYSRKLAVYNLCIYENGTRKVYCFYWDESNGKRGANEIATILNKYINIVDERGTVKNLLLYCDCCPGQNRNRIVMAMLHTTLQTCKYIETIQINFLLTGHTYMPVDSVHAVIERNLKKSIIYAPSQWYTVFTTARQDPEPYEVELLNFKDFNKWDTISEKYFKGNLTGKISKVRVVTFKKNKVSEIIVKNSMNENTQSYSVEVQFQSKTKVNPQVCYKSQLPISKAKYDDLLKLCREKVIPQLFHNEYLNLTTSSGVKDTLPETDIEDGDNE